jgi:hypothetical protein
MEMGSVMDLDCLSHLVKLKDYYSEMLREKLKDYYSEMLREKHLLMAMDLDCLSHLVKEKDYR